MKYDLVVITAANKAQARGYRIQLRGRKGVLVVPDPGDRRVGSLGATVSVLRRLLRKEAPARVLICHSGGDAKRTPAYAANGKAFVPMPDGRPLLDHIVGEMEKLPSNRGVPVCCGDVIPYLDASLVRFAPRGVTGVAYPDGPWQARRHGVYEVLRAASDGRRVADGLHDVGGFLQKPQVRRGSFLIDTGILHFDWATARKMARLPVAGDIYEEFPRLLLDGFAPFRVSVVPSCTFFHIGSSRELLKLLGRRIERPYGQKGRVSGRVLVDAVQAPIESLGGENIVTNVPACHGPIRLRRGECLTSLPLLPDPRCPDAAPAWYHLRYHVDDSFKEDGLWERHDLGTKMRQVDHRRLMALKGNAK